VDYLLDDTGAAAAQQPGDTAGVTPLFDGESRCERFTQRVLRFGPGSSLERRDSAADEVLYVLAGSGDAELGGDPVELHPGTAAFVPSGTPWHVSRAEGLEVLSVLVHEPLPGPAEPAVLDVAASDDGVATAGRQFRLLATPEVGCASVTQFVGYIPVGRAPDHFHAYDEVVYVLEGEGALHIGGETAALRPGSAVHLPARLVHCLENTGPGEMQVLGVFRPAGSPAEAYYPDGTRAQY
jgi:quercetin dioxygenase-like cupin family protein